MAGRDDMTRGGLPAGPTTLACGGPGCAETILAMELLVRGALELGEPGLFVSLEESTDDLFRNSRSFALDLESLVDKRELAKGDQTPAVATLVQQLPPPARKLIGDLSATEEVLARLDIKRRASPDGAREGGGDGRHT